MNFLIIITYFESLFYLNHEAVGRVFPILHRVAMRAFKKRLWPYPEGIDLASGGFLEVLIVSITYLNKND